MNKFGLFLCVLLAISYAQSSVVDGLDINDIYDKFVVISKGMADSTAYKCSANLLKNKQKIISTIENILNDVKGGKSVVDALIGRAVGLMFLDGFFDDCNVGSIISIAPDLLKVKGIQQVGQTVIQNASELENLFTEFTAAEDLDSKLIVIGKVIKSATGLTFH